VSDQNGNGNGERVTMRTLNDRIDLVRAEQKSEHIKTRALVILLATPSVARAIPYILGAFGLDIPRW
jgi:hypothetical protein